MKSTKIAISPADKVFKLAFLFDPEQEFSVFVLPDFPFDGDDAHASNVYIPAVDVIALGHSMHQPRINGVTVHNLNLGKSNSLFKSRRCSYSRNHHQLNELLSLNGKLSTLGFLESVFGG